jgi:hypothetical protein
VQPLQRGAPQLTHLGLHYIGLDSESFRASADPTLWTARARFARGPNTGPNLQVERSRSAGSAGGEGHCAPPPRTQKPAEGGAWCLGSGCWCR